MICPLPPLFLSLLIAASKDSQTQKKEEVMQKSFRLFHSILNRRRWEKRVASVLAEGKGKVVDSAARRYERIYKEKKFTPIEEAFPILYSKDWNENDLSSEGVTPPSSSSSLGSSGSTNSTSSSCGWSGKTPMLARKKLPSCPLSSRWQGEEEEDGDTDSPIPKNPLFPESRRHSRIPFRMPEDARVLNVAFLGPPNAGKTSLVNALALASIGAVSGRYGSTREVSRAITTVHSAQLILLDTPPIIVGKNKKGSERHAANWFGGGSSRALDAIFSVDLVVLSLPVGLGFVEDEHKKIALEVSRRAEARELPVVLTLTMMDKIQTPRHKEMYFSMRTDLESLTLPGIVATEEVSVKGGTGLVSLKDLLCRYARPGAWPYYRHERTDLTPVDRVKVALRQAYLDLLPHEIPHRLSQRLIGWTWREEKHHRHSVEVVAEVFFDRPAYLFTFYSKVEAITYRAQQLLLQEWGEHYHFVLQGFVSPGGVSTR